MSIAKFQLRLGVVILPLAAPAAGWGVVEIGLFERLHHMSRAHEDWQLDEVFSFMILASLVLPAVLLGRTRALLRAQHRTAEAQAEA